MTIIRYTQQKRRPFMLFQNNGTFIKLAHDKNSIWNYQIWHPQKWCLAKMAHFAKKCPKVTLFAMDWAEWLIFKRRFLIFFSTPECYSWYSLLCLMLGVGSISRMLVVLQKTNNVVVRYHLCWASFLGGGTFDKRSAVFVILCQWVP